MQKSSKIALGVTIAFFSVFLANLILGAFFDVRFMSDVTEMLALLATSVSFVTSILLIEKQEHSDKK
ncbi:MAG: hypothetical protein NXI13_01490 [Proteobacteria bacterium]|nr:hypothetical protein [Pseudomonadota bacterium]